ncbi:MAG TPA: hypothetical protein PKN50_16270 [Spirochaetota bacterium]|nr:hypothetical protein [Spirochaetota bacterium]
MKKLALIIPLLVLCCTSHSSAKISERTLGQFKSAFMGRVIEDNPEYEARIRRFMKGMILEGRMGMPILDKFGLFLSNMEKKGVAVNRIRFYSQDDLFCLFFVMKDLKDDQLYTMFLEYEFGKGGRCILKEIYFSIVFEERMKEIKSFFEAR